MDIIRRIEDTFALFEQMGMQKNICVPKTIYQYVSLPQKGYAEVWGNISRFYFNSVDYHTLKEFVWPCQLDEPYIEFGLNEKTDYFTYSENIDETPQSPLNGFSFSVVRPTGAVSCIYCMPNTHCISHSFILRHQVALKRLFPVIHRIFGNEVDEYSILQLAGNRCIAGCSKILAEFQNCTYETEALSFFIDSKENELLALLVNSIETLDQCTVPHYTSYERQTVADVQKILRESLHSPPSIRAIALDVGINPNKLQELFKYYSGSTVMEYLRSYRMQKALSLLDGDMLLYEIAREVGYRSVDRFSEAFTKTYGISPGKYRKMNETADYRGTY